MSDRRNTAKRTAQRMDWNDPSDQDRLFREIDEAMTIPEEMSGLEADSDQFEATLKLLRDNLEQGAGEEE